MVALAKLIEEGGTGLEMRSHDAVLRRDGPQI